MPEETTAQTATTNSGEAQQTATPQSTTDSAAAQQTTQTTTTEQKAVDVAPEKYEFKAPEGQAFDEAVISTYSEVAKELNLSQENAQKVIDKVSPIMEQRQMERLQAVRNEWAESSKVDTEFGGENLEANLGIARKALDQFGTPELKEFMNVSGLGNHPEMIRFLYRAGKAISEDNFVGGHKTEKAAPKNFNDLANKLYGS